MGQLLGSMISGLGLEVTKTSERLLSSWTAHLGKIKGFGVIKLNLN